MIIVSKYIIELLYNKFNILPIYYGQRCKFVELQNSYICYMRSVQKHKNTIIYSKNIKIKRWVLGNSIELKVFDNFYEWDYLI